VSPSENQQAEGLVVSQQAEGLMVNPEGNSH
jgi:hypothetical protein